LTVVVFFPTVVTVVTSFFLIVVVDFVAGLGLVVVEGLEAGS